MRLYASATSPYARKVRAALIELALSDRVTVIATSPLDDTDYRNINPLSKIPALELEDGSIVYDSLVIVDLLNQLAGGNRLIPAEPGARITELRRHALANGVIDATFNIAMEGRRPEAQRSAYWIGRWGEAIVAGSAALAREVPAEPTLAGITAAIAFDYAAFRAGHLGLDTSALGAWRERLGARPSLDTTLPQLELA